MPTKEPLDQICQGGPGGLVDSDTDQGQMHVEQAVKPGRAGVDHNVGTARVEGNGSWEVKRRA